MTLKIGFTLPHMGSVASQENISFAARFGESEGFDSLWVIDRILWPSKPQSPYPPSPDGRWPDVYKNVIDPISTLTYVAGLTNKIKLATGIIDMLYQNPLILAKRLVSLDNLSKGRLMLGLGVGHSKDEFQAAGVPFEKRGERADEFLEVLNKIWYDKTVEHKGKYYSIPKSVIGPKPFQLKIPIYLGTFSIKAIERVINSEARGWIGIPQMGIKFFKDAQTHLRNAARQHRRDPQDIEFIVHIFPEVSEKNLGQDRLPMNGSVKQIADDILELYKMGVSHINISFDFGSIASDFDKRLRFTKQIRDSMIPTLKVK
ncbi:MAG TPA: TIGR03619 family F420-dependent LLM class oxidoreductase [Nitrosopumilaceae archaeon]|nr:TIGR03619 family F420-dependent LLM class oxidoreductase [Nitrosopumilaceae archaeon]